MNAQAAISALKNPVFHERSEDTVADITTKDVVAKEWNAF